MATQYVNLPIEGSSSWKDPVTTASALPTTDNNIGDARVVEDTSLIYVWNGSAWVSTAPAGGITSINSDSTAAQTLTVGTAGTDFAIVNPGSGSHVFNLPTASASNRGVLSTTDWSTFNSKQSTVTIGALDAQTANTTGLALVSNVLSTQSADSTYPGMVNTTSQTFAGTKTFLSSIIGSLTGNADTSTTATNLAGGLGGSIPYQTAAGATAMLANGTAGQFLGSSGSTGAPFWANGVYTAPDPTTTYTIFEDFSTGAYSGGTGMIVSDNSWATTQSGSPVISLQGSTIVSDTNHLGVVEIRVTAANVDVGGLTTGVFNGAVSKPFFTGGGTLSFEAIVNINALSNGTDEGSLYVGLHNELGSVAPSNGMYIIYQKATSLNWYFSSSAASVTTTSTSTIPVTAGWHHLKIVVNAAGTSVTYFIDGVSAGTVTTNIPTVALPPRINCRKTLGAGNLFYGIDYISINKALTTPR